MNNWPIDPPTVANPTLGNVISPMLPVDGGFPENRRDFAAKAFHLFMAKLLRHIGDVNAALKAYHDSGGAKKEYDDYRTAANTYRDFVNHPVVREGFDSLDPLPSRVFAIEGLNVETRVEGDYCVGVNISGSVIFQAGGPVGESSSSSSSHPVLPPKWP